LITHWVVEYNTQQLSIFASNLTPAYPSLPAQYLNLFVGHHSFKINIMNSSSKVILGILGAAAAGAVIGMLLAPEKGSDIRQRVKDAANDWACQLADLFAEGKAELNNLATKASKKAKDFAGQGEDRFNNVRENLS
jgi:gas vesicle protein